MRKTLANIFMICMIFTLFFLEGASGKVKKQNGIHQSPHAKLQNININDVHWTGGFWADRFDLCHHTMIPNLWEIFRNPEISHAYSNFLIAAGLAEGEHHGPKFNDGDFYKWLEAVAFTYGVTKDAALDHLMDEIIHVIAQAQRGDGYLHTPVIIEQKTGGQKAQEIHNQLHFETYNMGHLMTAASIHFRATGKTSLLDVAIRAADYLIQVCKQSPKELASITICPSHYMGIMDIYRITGDSRYLDLANTLIDICALTENGTDQNQDRIPFREQTTAVGHAVRANYLYAGIADVYMETGDKSLFSALESIWHDVTFRKMYITGATGALYDGASPDGSKNHSEIQLVHQAYGRPYQLPNITAYNETCATIGNGLWNWRMLQITEEARFADVLELVLYNGILSGISLDGTHFFYTNPLEKHNDFPLSLRWSGERRSYFSSFCCPPNVIRTIAEVSQYAYSISDEGLWIHLYGSNKLDTQLSNGNRIALSQKTDYPWDGQVEIQIDSVEQPDFTLRLRIPGWADKANMIVNGKVIQENPVPGSYYAIQRHWKKSDCIEIDFPMPVKHMEAHPFIEELRNQVAVKRGPLVYCLESIDLPKENKISEIGIDSTIPFFPSFNQSLLGGVMVLDGTASRVKENDWSNRLYRAKQPSIPHPIPIRLIPYYAWGNCGNTEMKVWLPVR